VAPTTPEANYDGSQSQPRISQEFSAAGDARQAVQGAGVQNVYLTGSNQNIRTIVSVVPPFGQRNQNLPLRGRDELLSELTDSDHGRQVWVIHGLGGAGKTSLALEASFRANERGTEVWWVSAVDTATLTAGMEAVGRRLGISQQDLGYGDAADLIWHRLSARSEPWLLVVDNADQPQILRGAGDSVADGRGWLRPSIGQAGMVVVTSRYGTDDWGSWCHRHRLGMLPDVDAADVLADCTGHHPRLGGADDAELLAARLGGLPLALKIAGSYLASTAALPVAFVDSTTITTYRTYWNAMNSGASEDRHAASDNRMTQAGVLSLIGQILELSLDRLDDRQMPEARQVLRFLATLADAPIPYELMLKPDFMAADSMFEGITGPRLWEIVSSLDSFGLLEVSLPAPAIGDLGVAQLHPLIRDTSRVQMDSQDQIHALRLAALLLDEATEALDAQIPETWSAWQLLTPHVIEIFRQLSDLADPNYDALKTAAHTAYMTAMYQSERGFRAQAEELYRDVLEIQTRILGPENLSTLNTRHQLAHQISARGDHAGAEAEHAAVLDIMLQSLGPDNMDTLITRHCLAHQVSARGDHSTAVAEHRIVLEAQTKMLGPDSRRTLNTRRCLATEIGLLGDHASAEAELRIVLEAQIRTLEADDTAILSTRFELAWEILKQGDHEAAEAEYRSLLEEEERIFGPNHPHTLQVRFDLAILMSNRDDHEGALAGYTAVLEAQMRTLEPNDPQIMRSRQHRAIELRVLGDYAGALKEFRIVLEMQTLILGPENPESLMTRHQLAHVVEHYNQEEAASEFKSVLEIQERVLGPDNPNTQETLRCLGHLLASDPISKSEIP
jgi:tetratricopeptide (TPR) repeat protein